MAIIKKKETSLHKKRKSLYSKVGLSIITIILGVILIFKKYYLIAILPILSGCIVIKKKLVKIKILNSGIKGERVVAKILKKLPEDYIIYNDIQLFFRGKGAQIDHLILSPYGIVCIESKNLKGDILGDYDKEYWTLKKTGKHGGQYEKQFFNPCKQSLGHTYVIKNILNEKGISGVNTKNIVVFNEKTVKNIKINNCNMPVIKTDDLLDVINRFENKNSIINKEKLKAIGNIINKKMR